MSIDCAGPKASLARFEVGWSIKEGVAHRAYWIDLFLGWYQQEQAGKEVVFPTLS